MQEALLYRLRKRPHAKRFKAVDRKDISEQLPMAKYALQQEHNFLRLCGCVKWPEEMRRLRNKLLFTTPLDAELQLNSGK